jgi:four helix bundle protein
MKTNMNSSSLQKSNSKVNEIQRKHQSQDQNGGKIFDIRERSFQLSIRIMQISEKLPRTATYNMIRPQLLRSGTSIGANIEEADGCISKKDYLSKAVIARKEANETRYWLRLIASNDFEENIDDDINEVHEIIKILSVMINKVRYSKDQ